MGIVWPGTMTINTVVEVVTVEMKASRSTRLAGSRAWTGVSSELLLGFGPWSTVAGREDWKCLR